MEKLEEFIKENYKAKDGAKTSQWSEGNYDDVFSDGIDCGKAIILYDIACLLGIKVEELNQPEY